MLFVVTCTDSVELLLLTLATYAALSVVTSAISFSAVAKDKTFFTHAISDYDYDEYDDNDDNAFQYILTDDNDSDHNDIYGKCTNVCIMIAIMIMIVINKIITKWNNNNYW